MKNWLFALLFIFLPQLAVGQTLPVVTSFSILDDLVKQVGGDKVSTTVLVGENGDTHVYQPTPQDAIAVKKASLVFINGLEFEGWIERLFESSGYKGEVIVAADGIEKRQAGCNCKHHGKHKTSHDEHTDKSHDEHGSHHGHEHDHGEYDPHSWLSVKSVKVYVENIVKGLSKADPANAAFYQANAKTYQRKLDELNSWIIAELSKFPESQRIAVTAHDAFGYFARDYQVRFMSVQGTSTNSEASAKDLANLIREIKEKNIRAVFMENISNPALIKQIERETQATMGGVLYSDALSTKDEPASSYLELMRHNTRTLAKGFAG